MGYHEGPCDKHTHGHGVDYGHPADSDEPYEHDGRWYCGRCHRCMGSERPDESTQDDPYARIAELEAELAVAHDRIVTISAEVERRGRLIAEAEWADDGACPFEPLGGTWSTLTGPLHAPTCRAFTADGSVRWGDPEGQA